MIKKVNHKFTDNKLEMAKSLGSLSGILVFALCAQVSSLQVQFNVANLDGTKGEKGSFVMEIHDEWAPLAAGRCVAVHLQSFPTP